MSYLQGCALQGTQATAKVIYNNVQQQQCPGRVCKGQRKEGQWKNKYTTLKLVPVNLNISRAAQLLLEHKPKHSSRKQVDHRNGDTAIKISDRSIKVQDVIEGERFSCVKLAGGTLLCSCYVSPKTDDDNFLSCLEDLKTTIRGKLTHVDW